MTATFASLESSLAAGGPAAALQDLADRLRAEKKYHEMFEALKMKVRHGLGLPVLPVETNSDDLPDATRTKLEDGLVDACRQVGELLLADGKVREGWMYLRPVGDKAAAARLIAKIEPDEDNTEELIEVLLHEGVDTGRGYQLLLDRNGTCNSITTYDQILHQRPKKDRQAASSALLKRLYDDLVANVRGDIVRQEGTQPNEKTLQALVADRDWLFHDGAYHTDTTHLASVVRLSRVLEDPAELSKALDLTHYGRHLSAQLQYQGDEPFADQYPSHALYYQWRWARTWRKRWRTSRTRPGCLIRNTTARRPSKRIWSCSAAWAALRSARRGPHANAGQHALGRLMRRC